VGFLSASSVRRTGVIRLLYTLLVILSTLLGVGIIAAAGKLTPLAIGLFVGVAAFAIVAVEIPRPRRLKTRRALYVFTFAVWGLLVNIFIFIPFYNSPLHSVISAMPDVERLALFTLPGAVLGALLGEWVGRKLGYSLPKPP